MPLDDAQLRSELAQVRREQERRLAHLDQLRQELIQAQAGINAGLGQIALLERLLAKTQGETT